MKLTLDVVQQAQAFTHIVQGQATAVWGAGRLTADPVSYTHLDVYKRQDEPYRRALIGVYARLAATLKALTGGDAARHAVPPQNPYLSAQELLADLQVIQASLLTQHAQALVSQRLQPLMRAVEVFGFHLATVDLRQSSDQHEAVLAELLSTAQITPDYPALDEAAKCDLLMALLQDARPLRVMGASYSAHALNEIGVFEAAKNNRALYLSLIHI